MSRFTRLLHNIYSISTNSEGGANAWKTGKTLSIGVKVAQLNRSVSAFGWTGMVRASIASIVTWFVELKVFLTNSVEHFVGPAAGFVYSQLVFGKLDEEPTSLHHLFKVTGMQYVLVVSGFHLSLLARTVIASLQSVFIKKQVVVLSHTR